MIETPGFSGKSRSDIIFVRHQVFTLEQGVDPKIDLDGQDDAGVHVLVREQGSPVGTGRMLEDGHIGRVAVLKSHRQMGLGKMIIQALIEEARKAGIPRVYLGAQIQAVGFYEGMGFSAFGSVFEEAGIIHQHMELILPNANSN